MNIEFYITKYYMRNVVDFGCRCINKNVTLEVLGKRDSSQHCAVFRLHNIYPSNFAFFYYGNTYLDRLRTQPLAIASMEMRVIVVFDSCKNYG